MEFRVLGTLAADRDGTAIPLGSFRQRSLLGLLLIHANTVVSTDRILDDLWGDSGDRQNALWVHVSNLRSALEPDRARRSEGTVVLTRSPGYLVEVGPEALDAWRFEELLREGRSMLDRDPAAASMVIGEGLSLWRGRAYEDFAYEPFAQAEIARLEELRLEAVQLRLEADLRRGLSSELVGELEALVRLHPLREQFTAQLMLALHRSSRSSEALRAYRRLRDRLADELGMEPSSELARLEGRILVDDPELAAATGGMTRESRLAIRGYELRDKVADTELGPVYRAYQPMVGREVVVKVVRDGLADDPDFIRRFEAHAERVARLEHPHIVPLHDYWREPGAAYLVTRSLRGGSLEDRLRTGPLDVAAAAQVGRDVASALALAHRHGIAHGAVGPSTILLDDAGRGYLGDFAVTADDGPVATAPDVQALAATLSVATGRSLAGDFPDVASLLAAVDRELGAPPAVEPPGPLDNPFKGLRSFDEADANDFFGRERVVERLLARIGAGGAAGRLVVLVGPSGSGKSSVVRAGLVPALREEALPGSADWFVVDMTPGAHPFESLESALLRIAVDPPAALIDELVANEDGFRRAVERVVPDEHAQLVLVVDQFEELFTQATPATARRFLDALAAAVLAPNSRIRVVATLRGDFYDRPLEHRVFGELVRRSTEVITPMSPEELQRAVDGPAERAGVRFAPALMAQIVTDVADRPGALPLLQFALTELFERRRGRVVELDEYRAMGGVAGALVQRAEAIHADLGDHERAVARRVLLRLVTFGGEGAEQVARQRVLVRDLAVAGDATVASVLERFGQHRLLSFDRDLVTRAPTVEVAHEALLTEWERLRRWIDEGRDDLRRHRRLAHRVEEWRAAGRDEGYLLRDPELAAASTVETDGDLLLTAIEREYLVASRAHAVEERDAEARRRSEEDRLRRTARQRSRLLVAAAAVLAVVVALASLAVVERGRSDRLADELAAVAEGRRLAAASRGAVESDPQLALLLALQSVQVSADADLPALIEAEEALHWGLQGARVAYPVAGGPITVGFGPDGATGMFRLSLEELVDLAHEHLDRGFSADDCRQHDIAPCPSGEGQLASPDAADDLTLPRPAPDTPPDRSGSPLAGTSVTIGGLRDLDLGLGILFQQFEEATGSRVAYRVLPGDVATGQARSSATTRRDSPGGFDQTGVLEERPDIVIVPPGLLGGDAAEWRTIDLGAYIDLAEARQAFGSYLVDTATIDGRYVGVPFNVSVKGLVWYPTRAFAAAGYTVPGTWEELLALSRQIVADGGTPWCLGLETGGFGAWPATDWIEALVLRVGGTELYDAWVAHEVGFDDPRIAEAFTRFGEIVFTPGFVEGSPSASTLRDHFSAADPMLEPTPRCWLSFGSSWTPGWMPSGTTMGDDVSSFVLPPFQGSGEAPVFGDANFVATLTDRPEVRQFVQFMTRAHGGPAIGAAALAPLLPAHTGTSIAFCGVELGPTERDAWRAMCEAVQAAIRGDAFRADASDAMPPEVGQLSVAGERGAFVQGMVDYVVEGPASRDRILAEIEAAWPD